jgi:hypothetical protein
VTLLPKDFAFVLIALALTLALARDPEPFRSSIEVVQATPAALRAARSEVARAAS